MVNGLIENIKRHSDRRHFLWSALLFFDPLINLVPKMQDMHSCIESRSTYLPLSLNLGNSFLVKKDQSTDEKDRPRTPGGSTTDKMYPDESETAPLGTAEALLRLGHVGWSDLSSPLYGNVLGRHGW